MMACNLGGFLCTSISNLRVAEDAIASVLLIITMGILAKIAFRNIKGTQLARRIIGLMVGLTPFLIWKALGLIRRVFIDPSTNIYSSLYLFGEVLEALSALFILGSMVYMYILIKGTKYERKKISKKLKK